jgi:DNA polymerase-4
MNQSVYHIRLSDFELNAERLLDPALRTRAVAIISSHHPNGTIISLSDEAEQDGLYAGMKVSLARKMSHSALLLPYNNTLYSRMNSYIYKAVAKYSPIVEPTVFGQYFMDMTGMDLIYKNPVQAGVVILNDLKTKIEMESYVGISQNKLVSQISTEVVPEKIHKVSYGEESKFLSPLNSQILPTAQESTVSKMIRFLWLDRVQQIREITHNARVGIEIFGKHNNQLNKEANGQDHSRVQPPIKRSCITEQKIMECDTNDVDILANVVRTLAEQVAFKCRKRYSIALKVRLEIHYTDGFKSSKTGRFFQNDDQSVVRECLNLFEKANYRRNRLRSILIDATNFRQVSHQVELFENSTNQNDRKLNRAIDKIRKQYGFSLIQTASA